MLAGFDFGKNAHVLVINIVIYSSGQSAQFHYMSESIDTPGQILLQYKWYNTCCSAKSNYNFIKSTGVFALKTT